MKISIGRAINRAAAVTAVALALTLAACADREEELTYTRAGNLTIGVDLDPDAPKEKGNTLDVLLKDPAGKPVEQADVSVTYLMPAMGAMPEMKGKAEVRERGDGLYRARFDLPMGGSWTLSIDVESGERSARAEYSITVGRKGLTPLRASAVTADAHEHGQDEVAYYTCPMHPSVKSAKPGSCPICGMDLTPVTEREVSTGVITVDAQRRQTIGVRTAPVQRHPMTITVRAVGKVVYDETRLADVALKYQGWIGKLFVDSPGQLVKRGQPLFTLYSPELYSAQQEFLAAVRSQRAARSTSAPDRIDYLVDAARQRLRLWDLQPRQIDAIARTGKPLQYIPIVSPVSGYVVEKNLVEGSTVEPGMKLYRIADLDQIWIEAEVYESELPLIEEGDPVRITLPYLPGRESEGRVAFIYPYLDDTTRTGRVRIEVSNPGLSFKPDMYANVVLRKPLGERLAVPEESILYAGPRRFVFLDLGEGRLKPAAVEIGQKNGDLIEILNGVKEGDVIVTSGNFLIAAESRLKLAMEHWQ